MNEESVNPITRNEGQKPELIAGSLESANSSILPARNLFKDFGWEKIRILC